MRKPGLIAVSVIALVFGISCDSNGTGPAAETFAATLNGAGERPTPVVTPAAGTGTFTLSEDGNTLSWNVVTTGANNVTASHIHIGGREIAGPIVLPLYAGAASSNPAITGSVIMQLLNGDS